MNLGGRLTCGASQLSLAELLRPLEGTVSVFRRPDGTRLRVVEAGSGNDVLLVHGFGMTADSWSVVQPALVEQGFRVIAFDQRAHGLSSCGADGLGSAQLRADLHAVADAYGISEGTLVCHSMGNFVALGCLPDETFRKRLRRAVLVSPTTGTAAKGAPVVRLQGPLVKFGLIQLLARVGRIGRALAGASTGPAASPDVIEATRRSLIAIPSTVGPCLDMQLKETVEPVLASIDLPLQVLAGTADNTTPTWHAELIVAKAPDARIDYVADVGHMLIWEAPDQIVDAVAHEWH